jgi:hypothetical protein
MNRRAVRLEERHEFFSCRRFGVLQLRHPLAACLAFVVLQAAACGLQYSGEDRTRIADQTEVDIAVLADSPVVHVDLHKRQFLTDALAIPHPKIERRADDNENVRIGKRL